MKSLALAALLLAAFGGQVQAQSRDAEPARRERAPLANPDDLEPAVDVGGTRLAVAQRPDAPAPAATPPAVTPGATSVAPAQPSAAASAAPTARSSTPLTSSERAASPRALDSIDLGTTSITGNQELPKVLYIVPWKRSDLGDLVGRPVNTLLDEVLAPVDPEVFERHLNYYESLNGKQGQ